MRRKIWLCGLLVALGVVEARNAVAADFTVTNSGASAYVINAQSNPTLTLTRGQTYTFAVDTPGHPFYIKTAQVTGTGSTFDTGVTNNGTTSGTLTFTVPASAPSPLFYQCAIHTAMTGTLAIVAPPSVPAGGGLTRGVLGVLIALAGFGALGGVRRALTRRSPG
jgi:hypothetical protein